MEQFQLDFEGGLTDRYSTFGDCLKASVYSCGRQLKAVASDLDMSPSELSRKLADNPHDPVHFPAIRLPELLVSTGNLDPLYWLVEKLCASPDLKRRKSIDRLARLLPEIERLVKESA